MTMTLPDSSNRILTLVTTVVGTAVLFIALAYSITWINLLGIREFMPETTQAQISLFAIPGLVLGIIAGLLTLRKPARHHYPIGLLIYNITRNTFNALRSIEPIMMGFVFVVWVGLGPFAGIMALTLHSVADLGKLFSEEVENIDEGPVEAVTATGANQFQSIVYAVVPQITPHYIAYIFYRWDINVRMSTIIGFVGGGGIGFVLNRTINQLLYTKASVMIIAIAVVVTILDNISARIRSRII
jgi:phosphonate ABC transporter permease subunit PhnE